MTVTECIKAYMSMHKEYISTDLRKKYAWYQRGIPEWFARKNISSITLEDIKNLEKDLNEDQKTQKYIAGVLCLVKHAYRYYKGDIFDSPRVLNSIGYVVYFIRNNNGEIKIGVTNSLEKRLGAFRTAFSFEPELLYEEHFNTRKEAYKAERHYHQLFADHRISGEWFAEKIIIDYLRRKKH